jgi:hypothetical protein
LAAPCIIRRPIAAPSSPSGGFYYNLLLDKLPFTDARKVCPADGDYFTHCVRQGVFTTEEELDTHLVAWSKYNLWTSAKLDALRGNIKDAVAGRVLPLDGTALDAADARGDAVEVLLAGATAMEEMMVLDELGEGDAGAAAAAQFDPVQRLRQALALGVLPEPTTLTPDVLEQLRQEAHSRCHPQLPADNPLKVQEAQLSAQQRSVITSVLATLQLQASQHLSQGAGTLSAKPHLITLQGGPGTGKSALTRALVHRAISEGYAGLVTATSATAAQRLGFTMVDTIDAVCQIPIGRPLAPLRPDDAGTFALQQADFVVCDELSLLTSNKLLMVMHMMSQATAAGKPRKILLLVGDLHQLPPVCRHSQKRDAPPELCEHCHLLRSAELSGPGAQHHHLQRVYRQAADPAFAAFLDRVRCSRLSQQQIDAVMKDCYRPLESLPALLTADTTILCTHR